MSLPVFAVYRHDADILRARFLRVHLLHVFMAWLRTAMRRAAQARVVSHMQRNRGCRMRSRVLAVWLEAVEAAWHQGQQASKYSIQVLVKRTWAAWHLYLQGTYAVGAAADAMQWARARQQAAHGLRTWRHWAAYRAKMHSLGRLLQATTAARNLAKAWLAWQGHCLRAAALHEAAQLATAHRAARVLQAAFSCWGWQSAHRARVRLAATHLQQGLAARQRARLVYTWAARTQERKAAAHKAMEEQALQQQQQQQQRQQQAQDQKEAAATGHAMRKLLRSCMRSWRAWAQHSAHMAWAVGMITARSRTRMREASLDGLRVNVAVARKVGEAVQHMLTMRHSRTKAHSWRAWRHMAQRMRGLRAACCRVAAELDKDCKETVLQ
ncbi:hypothetical protein DUNSADRAFT_17710, partial [Dunaliella salina]